MKMQTLDNYIIKLYQRLKEDDLYISADELPYLEDEEFKYKYLLLNGEERMIFSSLEECNDWLEERQIENFNLKRIVPLTYYAAMITNTLEEYMDNLSRSEIIYMIQNVWENISVEDNCEEELDIFAEMIEIIEDADDLEEEFLQNPKFKRSILVTYIYDVLNQHYLKQTTINGIEQIIWRAFNRNQNVENVVSNILVLLSNYNRVERLIATQIFIDNMGYAKEIKLSKIKEFNKDYNFRIEVLTKYVNDAYAVFEQQGIRVYSITQIARDVLDEIYVNLQNENRDNVVDFISDYLLSDKQLMVSKYRNLFLSNSNLEKSIKNLIINILIMDYSSLEKNTMYKRMINNSSIRECVKKFVLNDEFRYVIIAEYFSKNKIHNINNVDEKYRVLTKIDSL